ncbi:phosphatase PAP2 family protein [Trinickia sp. LjRoot230]|uniref:phosphatase PAP2 family protein n=1 Tax=Trinickia sp. LjRoot230 TaxID=3342288 RepID=UPI003ECF293D
MTDFDTIIQTFLTEHAFHSELLNHAVRVIAGLYTFKGLVLIPILWWIWFKPSDRSEWKREMVIATIVSGLLALAIGRMLAHYLPYRVRPVHNPDLHLHFPPAGLREPAFRTWGSFPSDHAMLWVSIAAGIFMTWRRVGIFALLYAAIFICAPRVYLGLHYPTDILAGAALGVAITYLMTRDALRVRFAAPALRCMERFPALSYTAAFLLSFELITQFDELLMLVQSISKAI